MSIITASNIPTSVTNAKLQEFFSFCGHIQNIDSKNPDGATRTVDITFESPSALQTALLLNGAELAGNQIVIVEAVGAAATGLSNPPGYASTLAPPPVHPSTPADSLAQTPNEDISQEHKPKTAILAQYLSLGYLLSDNLISKAVEYDQQNGYSAKFKSFLTSLDSKYHIQEKSAATDKKFAVSETLQRQKLSLDLYYDHATLTSLGSKIHKFYLSAAKDAKEVHEEALRLAALKKQQQGASASTDASLPSFTEATGSTSSEYGADKKA